MRGICALVALVLTSGCVHFSEAYRLSHSSILVSDYMTSPRTTEEVHVFIMDDIPPADCERVALLRAAPTATVVDRLREEAGRIGANAVDLRDYRYPDRDPNYGGEVAWNAVALYCPEG